MSVVETVAEVELDQTAEEAESDRTTEDFRLIFQHLDDISRTIQTEADDGMSKDSWFAEGVDILSTVSKVGAAVLPFLDGSWTLKTSAFNTLVIGDVTASFLSLGVLVNRLVRRNLQSGVAEAKALVRDTFGYLQVRLKRLHTRMAKVDAAVLPLKTMTDADQLQAAFKEFKENVRLCRLDIGECLEKLDELRPKLDKCVKKLCRRLKVSSAAGGILGAAGLGAIAVPVIGWPFVGGFIGVAGGLLAFAADCAKLKGYFVEHRSKCNSIYPDLKRMLRRLQANVDALKGVGQGDDVPWTFEG